MAAGFKQATVNASDVPATQTDFPTYVDLARLGITTLAEAQSVRVYADSAKTIEWAREIVSVTEMHFLVPSFTSTTEPFVDWDGVRADYAVGATYGRNAVWSNSYDRVYHFQEAVNNSAGGYIDSTGNGNATGVSMSLTEVQGKLAGNAQDFDGSADYIDTDYQPAGTVWTWSAWFNHDDTSGYENIMSLPGATFELFLQDTTSRLEHWSANQSIPNAPLFHQTTPTNAVWNYGVSIREGNSITDGYKLYLNAIVGSDPANSGIFSGASADLWIGGRQSVPQYYDGKLDEVRVATAARSANWITTEYNNQNDEATFWGTWADVGGGPAAQAAQVARQGVVMMM